jgi:adenylate kinase
VATVAINRPFSSFDAAVKTKLLLLGGADSHGEDLLRRARSLHIEHVSSVGLMRRGISRHPGTDEAVLAPLRRWFFSRKPDAGFVLTDFPATLLQAKVFDEWLDARDESLDAVHAGPGAPAALVAHYRDLGLTADAAPPFTLPLAPEGAAGDPRSAR